MQISNYYMSTDKMNIHSFIQQIFSRATAVEEAHTKSLPSWSFCSKGQDKQETMSILVVVPAETDDAFD